MADLYPTDLKPIVSRFMARATQMDALAAKRGDVSAARVAYYCRMKALTAAIEKRGSFSMDKPENSSFLTDLMNQTERQKGELGISAATKAEDAVRAAIPERSCVFAQRTRRGGGGAPPPAGLRCSLRFAPRGLPRPASHAGGARPRGAPAVPQAPAACR